MKQEKLKEILEKHKLWLDRKEGGERADLQGADLSGASLYEADLQGAALRGAALRGADLRRADLEGANLSRANLSWADLNRAYLSRANLSGANLTGADLREADLEGADLYRTNLEGANLEGAKLKMVELQEANLREANLKGTCLDPEAPVPVPSIEEIKEAGLELKGDKVWGWRTAKSIRYGETEYVPGQVYEAPVFSVDTETDCHPGIYLASKEWVENWYPNEKLVRCYALRNELVHACNKWNKLVPAGNKWRAKRIWIVEENETN